MNFHLLCKVLHQSPEHFFWITKITDAFLNKDKETIHTCSRTHHTSYLKLQNSVLVPLPSTFLRKMHHKAAAIRELLLKWDCSFTVSEVKLQLHSEENHQEPTLTGMADSSSFKTNKLLTFKSQLVTLIFTNIRAICKIFSLTENTQLHKGLKIISCHIHIFRHLNGKRNFSPTYSPTIKQLA